MVEIWPGSHLHNLHTTNSPRLLHETTRLDLEKAGCIAELKEFPSGGLIIRDARTYAEIKKGYAITFLFAVPEALSKWPKILLENSTELIRLAVNMETPTIKLNFAVKDASA
ncbi:hypothetical protein NW759_016815 [Fusarium solani]|nr:hypothetical protein NW759_016815 [Fusarium solani]